MRDLCAAAVDAATGAGAEYADARVVLKRNQLVATKNGRVERVTDAESEGIGVRVLVDGAWGFACDRRLTDEGARDAALRACTFARAAAGGESRAARARSSPQRDAPHSRSSATRSPSRSRRRSTSACAPTQALAGPDVIVRQAMVRAQREHKLLAHVRGHGGRAGADRVRRRDRLRRRTRRRLPDAQLPERARRLELPGRLGVRRRARPRAARRRASPSRRPPSLRADACPSGVTTVVLDARPGRAAGARVRRPPDRARPRLRHRGRRTPARASSSPTTSARCATAPST